MANDKANPEIEELAFRIYAECLTNRMQASELLVIDCYRKAELWVSTRDKIRAGTATTAKPDTILADCRAPNQPKNFPLNMVSQAHGDLNKVNRIAKWFQANPPTDDQDELEARFTRDFPELSWPTAELNRARNLFPHFVKSEAK